MLGELTSGDRSIDRLNPFESASKGSSQAVAERARELLRFRRDSFDPEGSSPEANREGRAEGGCRREGGSEEEEEDVADGIQGAVVVLRLSIE